MRIKTLGLSGIILGLCLFLSGCKNLSAYREVISEAIVIDNPEQYDESLEGKYVLITGKVTTNTGAYDSDFGIQFDGPVAYRDSQTLYSDWNEGKIKYYWSGGGSTIFIGIASIGAYRITGDTLKYLFTKTYNPVTQELADEAGMYYWESYKYSPGKYLLRKPLRNSKVDRCKENEGTTRYWYDVKVPETEIKTIFGYVQNGYIVDTEEFKIQYLTGYYTKEEFIKKVCG